VKPTGLEAVVPAGATLLIDTSVVLAYLSGVEATSAAAAVAIDGMVASGRNPAVLSTVTVSEVLVRPLRAEATGAVRIVEDFLLRFPNLRIEPVTFEIAVAAARIRAAIAAPTPDALILATGQAASATVALSSDRRWERIAAKASLSIRAVDLGGFAGKR
jgi:predicted nucleic acid-binding protein